MKILHIIPNLRKGGAERLCLDVCNGLSTKEGVQVKLITFSDKNDYPFLTGNIDWEVVPCGINLSVLKKNRYSIFNLQEAINQFSPNIIHTHLFESEIVSRSVFYPNAKWFSHCHDNMVQFSKMGAGTFLTKKKLTNYYEKRYLFARYKKNGGTHFLAISKDTEAYFKETAKPYPVTLLPNAIDYQRFSNIAFNRSTENTLRLVNIGSFVENKNQQFLLLAAAALKIKGVNFELHLIGDGVKRPDLENLAGKLGIDKNVVFHGNIHQVENLLWKSSIYIHSALTEGLSLTTLEAMAAGLPVITLDGKGNRDLILQRKNGFMIYERNPLKFADKIIELWTDKDLYKKMAAYANEFAKGYDIKGYVERLLEIYREAT